MSKGQPSRREFWQQLVAQQQQSGISVRAFCRQLARLREPTIQASPETIRQCWSATGGANISSY